MPIIRISTCFYCTLTLFLCFNLWPSHPLMGQVLFNELRVNPPGEQPTNSMYINRPCTDNYKCFEWVELYNPHPTRTLDVSCHILGSNISDESEGNVCPKHNDTIGHKEPNRGFIVIPEGTTIPPLSFITIGGREAEPAVTVALNTVQQQIPNRYCGSPRYFLRSARGWVALFTPEGQVVNAVYWTLKGREEIQTHAVFANRDSIDCSCIGRKIFIPSARDLLRDTLIDYIGSTEPLGESDYIFRRVPDGGCWESSLVRTPNAPNEGEPAKIPVDPMITTSFLGDTLCRGQNFLIEGPDVGLPPGCEHLIRYRWKTNPPLPFPIPDTMRSMRLTILEETTFYLHITLNKVDYYDTLTLPVRDAIIPAIEIVGKDVCVFDSTQIQYTGEMKEEGVYIWKIDTLAADTVTQPRPLSIVWQTAGRKQITVQTIYRGCTLETSGIVTVHDFPRGRIVLEKEPPCTNDTIGLRIQSQVRVRPIAWFLSDGISLSPVEEIPHRVWFRRIGTRRIWATVANANHPCVSILDTTTFEVIPKPPLDISFAIDSLNNCNLPQIEALLTNDPSYQYFWDFDGATLLDNSSGPGPHRLRWNEAGVKRIELQVQTPSCTTDVLRKPIVYQPNEDCAWLYALPNAFSPNDSPPNDVYSLIGFPAEFGRYRLRIFSRWGRYITTLTNEQPTWNGEMEGQPAPEGVYIYDFEIQLPSGRTGKFVGNITLIR